MAWDARSGLKHLAYLADGIHDLMSEWPGMPVRD